MRYYFHYLVVVAAGTGVDSVCGFVTYNGILVGMGVSIADATVVIAAVVAVVAGILLKVFFIFTFSVFFLPMSFLQCLFKNI